MKNLSNFINEALSGIASILENVKINFGKTVCSSADSEDVRYEVAKQQAQMMVEALSQGVLPENWVAMDIETWCENNRVNYSPQIDSEWGDLVISDGSEDWFIDLKVSMSDKYIGTPSILSLVNFSKGANRIYFMSNSNGSQIYIVDAAKLMDLMLSMDDSAFLVTSRARETKNNQTFREVEELTGKVNIRQSKTGRENPGNDEIWGLDHLNNDDFVSSYTIRMNYGKIRV